MKLCDYIYKRLEELGIGHVFCIPGESVQELYRSLLKSNLKNVLLSHEVCCGYAADAYSRLMGLGAVLVSYGVGSLNMTNAVGQAYAESSPLIVISGGPSLSERKKYPLLHHKVRTFETQQRVFAEITAMSIIIDSPLDAANKLELAFQTALQYKKPVYIEIPRDISQVEIHSLPLVTQDMSDLGMLKEALDEVVALLNQAKKPVILAGVEAARLKLRKEVLDLIEKTGLPAANTLLDKSILREDHPQSLGTFFGTLSNPRAARYLEEADLILSIGVILSDINLGMFTFPIDRTKMIEARIDSLRVKHHSYPEVTLEMFLKGLLDHAGIKSREIRLDPPALTFMCFQPEDKKISAGSLELILNQFLNRQDAPSYRIVSDVGDCLFVGQALYITKETAFLSPAYYLSMGFAVPGAIGAQIADPKLRPIVLVGDGAFQMTGLELISAHRLGLNPIIVLMNNGVYGTLKSVESDPIPNSYDIGNYDYTKLAQMTGGVGMVVETESQFAQALAECENKYQNQIVLLDIRLAVDDITSVLKTFGAMMGESNQKASQG
ncbi:MAG: thiamine pyrophosphate-binding protein [Candidatus Caenarcaniphilales bacterium]|nr:thiamine pyrophosphate-binding protein [Candidatus Caenarcaniphilales bacterium]